MNCYNCSRPRHFVSDCNRPKKEDRYKKDEKKDDRSKERSRERRMRTRSEKRPNRKNDRKVLVAKESNKNWVDLDSESTSSSSSSSDSEPEDVHCLMADQTLLKMRLKEVMSSWTKSFVSLSKLHETQKPLNDKSGLGFCVGESNSEGTSTQSDLAYDKFKVMNFVKASVIHNAYESVKYDDQTSTQPKSQSWYRMYQT
ncbi:hypothetical protein F511_25172 [Dorcoceras hygrometricum]|uniref:CCHC-type domain-containing protein n=1 Tax=Dorcoceras hygrometricum TaxID=472368 RepID=A0A2Z7AUW6_9LAMI|nr:hypothetical protein F511_25172 [Dorcoceras hygrometricum]